MQSFSQIGDNVQKGTFSLMPPKHQEEEIEGWISIALAISQTGHQRSTVNDAIGRGELKFKFAAGSYFVFKEQWEVWAKQHPPKPRKK